MLVLDGSKSIGEENFEKVKEWVKNLGRSLQIDQEFVKIGVVSVKMFFSFRLTSNKLPCNESPHNRLSAVVTAMHMQL